MPDTIPAGAANALGLGEVETEDGTLPLGQHTQDLSSANWPMLCWDSPNHPADIWVWRRVDWPICAVRKTDGTWERQGATC